MIIGDLKQFIEDQKQLPSLPPVALKLIEITRDDTASFEQVARIIESDQALTSRVLRIANSAAFGLVRQVQTVDRAIALLGLELIRSMALSLLVVEVFNDQGNNGFDTREFWRHNAACAVASEIVAQRFAYPRPQEAFIAGLLHDLGKLVFYHWDEKKYSEIVQTAYTSRKPLLEIEEAQFGLGHNRLGKMLMEQWNFPTTYPAAAWLHHQPVISFGVNPRSELSFIIKCANNLCHLHRFGTSGNPQTDISMEELEHLCGMTPEEMTSTAAEILKRLDEISEYFNWETCTPAMYLSAMSQANDELAELHVQVVAKNRQIENQNNILTTICRMQESLPAGLSLGRALERIVELLSEAIPSSRIMTFVINEREGLVEGRLLSSQEGMPRRVTLPLEGPLEQDFQNSQPRQQFSLIEQAVLRLGEGLEVAAEITEALRSANLIVLPLEAGGITLGQLLVEFQSPEQNTATMLDLLRQYAKASVMALERVLLFEALEQQADDLARMARKGQETQKRLYQTERLASVGRLAAGAAHEINNPLAAISAQAQLLIRRIDDPKDEASLQSIIDQSNRISKIISDLMGFARPAEPRIEPTLIKSVLEHTLSVLENRMKVAGVTIQTQFDTDLPLIYADSQQLEQVFLNLTINAMQAMPGGGTLTIRLRMEPDQERIRLDFKDTGVGIAQKNIASIFDPFYTTKKEGEGTGLGLAICHTIIESHQGEISVMSEKGKGTTFTIFLPLGGMSEIRKIQSDLQRKQRPAPAKNESSSGSVLIIDDEEALRKVLAESLTADGYDVDFAIDGAEGLDKLSQNQYDVTLVDLRMPKVEGMEVLTTVRKSSPRMPVIVISGLAHERDFQAAQKAGAFACIKKPFNVIELLDTVQRAIRVTQGKSGAAGNQIA